MNVRIEQIADRAELGCPIGWLVSVCCLVPFQSVLETYGTVVPNAANSVQYYRSGSVHFSAHNGHYKDADCRNITTAQHTPRHGIPTRILALTAVTTPSRHESSARLYFSRAAPYTVRLSVQTHTVIPEQRAVLSSLPTHPIIRSTRVICSILNSSTLP